MPCAPLRWVYAVIHYREIAESSGHLMGGTQTVCLLQTFALCSRGLVHTCPHVVPVSVGFRWKTRPLEKNNMLKFFSYLRVDKDLKV